MMSLKTGVRRAKGETMAERSDDAILNPKRVADIAAEIRQGDLSYLEPRDHLHANLVRELLGRKVDLDRPREGQIVANRNPVSPSLQSRQDEQTRLVN
jgi:hypothetical protein